MSDSNALELEHELMILKQKLLDATEENARLKTRIRELEAENSYFKSQHFTADQSDDSSN
jgi:hypothetical protein